MTKEVEKLLGLVLFHTGELVFCIVDDTESRPPNAKFGFSNMSIGDWELVGRHGNGHHGGVYFDMGPMCRHEPFKDESCVCSGGLGVGDDGLQSREGRYLFSHQKAETPRDLVIWKV